jgi:predicted enzyme related to lactoylglutathione lyase
MPGTVRPILASNDLARLRAFYTSLLGAREVVRYPDDGDAFYVGLEVGDSELGIVADSDVTPGDRGRVLLSIDVPDVHELLPLVEELGGRAPGGANDMPWGQRVAHITDPDGNAVNLTQEL